MAYPCPNKEDCKNNIPFKFTKYFKIEDYVQRQKYDEIIEAEPYSMDINNGKLTLTLAVRLNKNDKSAAGDFDTLLCANIEKAKISIIDTTITTKSENNETVTPSYKVAEVEVNSNKPSEFKVISEYSTTIQKSQDKVGSKSFIFPNTYYFTHGKLGITVNGTVHIKGCNCQEELKEAAKGSADDVSSIKTKTPVADASITKAKGSGSVSGSSKTKATIDVGTSKSDNDNVLKPGLAQDLGIVLNNEKYSDVMLTLDSGKTISAHKVILWARSKGFAEKIEEEDKPYISGKMITIPVLGFKQEVVQEALHFMYTNDCPKLSEMPADLLSFGDKFKIPGLKKIAEDEIKSIANPENICTFLNLADANNYEELKTFCIEFVRKNKKPVVDSPGWKVLKKNNPGVIASVFEMAIND